MKTSSSFVPTDALEVLVKSLFPEGVCLQLQHVEIAAEEITCLVASTHLQGCCPICGETTRRIHSRYQRRLQDLPWSGLRLCLHLQVRRFFCPNPHCPRRIFNERLPLLTEAFARRTNRLQQALLQVGWVLGGEAGARLCSKQGMPVCASTLLTLLRRAGAQECSTPRVLGVDDWGFQQKHPTGTVLVDLEHHRVVDVLLGSDEEVLTRWLDQHTGVEVLCRDRGAGYRNAATKAVPQIQQVLDRWHLVKNLGDVLQKILGQQVEVLRQASQQAQAQQTPSSSTEASQSSRRKLRKPPRRAPPEPSPRRAWQMMMHEQVHEIAATGKTQAEIADQLHLNRHTVRKYLRMPTFVAHYWSPYPSPVEPYRS